MHRRIDATERDRKTLGAFFTPWAIADFLARWAIADDLDSRVLDPTCGDGAFLMAAASRLAGLGVPRSRIAEQLTGIDINRDSVADARKVLKQSGVKAQLIHADFLEQPTPAQLEGKIGWHDAIVGNPPFIRYQSQAREARTRSAAVALAQGVRLSGLASSWAATLVHASAFLKPTGRLAMVLPAELMSVGYAEPLRRWLRERFAAVNLFMFERLQFADAEEQVVLLVARGRGPCDSFGLYYVDDAADLANLHPADNIGANPADDAKWTDLLLPLNVRQLVRGSVWGRMTRLDEFGVPELGTVTGANHYFTLNEATRLEYGIAEKHLMRLSPPGTRHLKGLSFTRPTWEELKFQGERVWLFHPADARSRGVQRYLEYGEDAGVPKAYKCTVRTPWWRPPAVLPPDLFFTYMSHRYPRIIANTAKTTLVNSMHGVRLREGTPAEAREALPLLAMNSATMLSAEILGRAYGGGILKMEPREAAALPVPRPNDLAKAWNKLRDKKLQLDRALQRGDWWSVVAEVDTALLKESMGLAVDEVAQLRDWAAVFRVRRTRQTEDNAG